jgi:hypothetical protein
MKENNKWSRRKFSKAALSLQVLITSGLINIPVGCAPKNETTEDGTLGLPLQKLLQLAMDEIIPRHKNMPAASEVGGIEYILNVLKEYPDLLAGFKQLLTTLRERSKDSTNDEFENLNKDSRILVLKQFEKDQPDMFSVLQNFVFEGYYINEEVWKLIGYEPFPTLSAGPEMEPFDEAILERVKQMSSFYLNV